MPVRTLLPAMLVLVAACSGRGSHAAAPATVVPLRDPMVVGQYGVGTSEMTFTRQTADGPRVLKTQFWYPTDATPGAPSVPNAAPARGERFPIVILSHGSGGEPQFHQYLTQHLASWGYVIAAPEHTGNTLADCFLCDFQNIIASARLRPDDVTFVLDQVIALKDDPAQPLGPVLDTERTAIAGHSFGGWTAIYTAPGGRFDVAIALAPGLPGTLMARATTVRIPTLIIAGSDDEIVPVAGVDSLFQALPADGTSTYVTLRGGRHLSFIDNCLDCTSALSAARGHDLINGYVTAFLETRLRGDARYAADLADSRLPDAIVAAR
jgi:predicted dienelactone hydrolase